jgi:FkbM family methyltransferase
VERTMRLAPRLPRPVAAVALIASVVATGCKRAPRPEGLHSSKGRDPTVRQDIVSTGRKLYSAGNEELIIRDFFQDRRGGVFLDVGCAWPIKENNTCYLEKHLGWSGIVVDALPDYAQAWRRRSRSRFFNYLVTDHFGTTEPFYRAELTDISSFRPTNAKAPKVKYQEIRVPTITLTRLLEDNGLARIDFMSMDIEDAEPMALAGFDIARFRPELACVEVKSNRDKIRAWFDAHGYERLDRYDAHDRVNDYFTPRPGAH